MDAKKKYYRIDGMPLAMQVWIYECCSAVDLNIAEKKTNCIPRLVNWRTRNNRIHYEFLMEGMFGDNGNPLKYKNIQPSLKEIAFYQLPSKSDAIPENTFQNVGDKDDEEDNDFTSKPPSHKPHNKEKGKQKVTVSLSTSIKKFNMHAGSSCKEKSPPVLHGYRKAKSTPFSSVSTPLENNVPIQELHNQPDESTNTTPPRSSKQPQDTKAGGIGDIAYDMTYVDDIPQQGSAFVEYLSEGEGIPVQYLDSKLHRIRYGALLWQYAVKKMEEGDVSENEAPPRMMRPPARIDNSQLVRID
ncbi:uncharacterized protein LOC125835741 [Solanum verrucosum]|uniref:uncharacterized protein LOC125835741 n=1 Tax=Solanum verrucosum TaxID=315347 RepID=UPI0020D16235|nr:uncharacterized protein LOC125835741 [Solanum verrucosum]